MRFTPKAVFLGIVAIGLPFAVLGGWSVGSSETPAPVVAEAPGGAGGLGAAPAGKRPARATTDEQERSTRQTRPVSVIESVPVPTSAAVSTPPVPTPAQTSVSASPANTLTMPPVPTPTQIDTSSASPEPVEEPVLSDSAPPPSGLGPLRWGRRH